MNCNPKCPLRRGLGGEGRQCECSRRATHAAYLGAIRALTEWAKRNAAALFLVALAAVWACANAVLS